MLFMKLFKFLFTYSFTYVMNYYITNKEMQESKVHTLVGSGQESESDDSV